MPALKSERPADHPKSCGRIQPYMAPAFYSSPGLFHWMGKKELRLWPKNLVIFSLFCVSVPSCQIYLEYNVWEKQSSIFISNRHFCFLLVTCGKWLVQMNRVGSYRGPFSQRNPSLGLRLCYHHLELIANFKTRAKYVYFVQGPTGYIARSADNFCSV